MTDTKIKTHPTEAELADYLDKSLSAQDRMRLEDHMAGCSDCLAKMVSAHESVELFRKNKNDKKGEVGFMKKMNIYLILAILAFALSFAIPRYFIQLLVATLLLGIKWIVDSKSTKMLVMIYEAWKRGGDKEAGQILKILESGPKNRF
jgi:hypothetical protein